MQKDPTTDNFPGLEPETSRPDIMVVGPRPDDENSQIIYQGYLYKQVILHQSLELCKDRGP